VDLPAVAEAVAVAVRVRARVVDGDSGKVKAVRVDKAAVPKGGVKAAGKCRGREAVSNAAAIGRTRVRVCRAAGIVGAVAGTIRIRMSSNGTTRTP
jgi:hypothetical protein